jgi:signal transduction histidine kinase
MVFHAEQERHAAFARENAHMPGHGLRILVADDDDGARLGLHRLLEGEGFVVDVAEDGERALDMAREVRPDVVLTDVQMPVMDGIELCRRLHELDPTTPVLVMTAAGAIPNAVTAMRAGAVDYLTKPIEIDAALLGIRRALEIRAVNVERDHLRLQQQALLGEALAAVRTHEEVISIVAHDLRNPLQILELQAHVLANTAAGQPAERLRSVGDRLLRETTRMSRLVADLLDESRIRTGHMTVEKQRVSVRDVMADMVELRPLAWQARVALRIDMSVEERTLFADRARLGQVFANLITNAIKFSPAGGSIVVSVQESAGGMCFSVRDDGPGIVEEDRPRLFERFWQGSGRHRGGVGLGLHIAKTIVESHGGSIWAESEFGHGTTFRVLFPLAVKESAEHGAEA